MNSEEKELILRLLVSYEDKNYMEIGEKEQQMLNQLINQFEDGLIEVEK